MALASESTMSTLEKPTHEDEATVLAEGHPLHVGVWLSQYTYYYNEFIKGVISLTLKDPDTVIERVVVHLKCVGNHIVIGEPVTQLYKTSRELLSYGEELTLTGETVDMRFSFPLPDHHDCFLPSFQLGSRRVTWFVFATVELANGAVYRTTYKQGQFRLGVVYKPMSAFHPRVFSNVKSLLRSAKQIQVSLDKPVFMTSEPVRVKLSASIPTHQITGVKIHVVQDLQFGKDERTVRNVIGHNCMDDLDLTSDQQDFTNTIFEVMLNTDKPCAVVEDQSFRDQKISQLAPTMTLQKDGHQYVSISYRLFVEMTVGRMVRQYMVLHLPFILTDLSPPPDMLTHIIELDPPVDDLPSYGQVPSKSKVGRPLAVAPHVEIEERRRARSLTNSPVAGGRSGSVAYNRSVSHLVEGAHAQTASPTHSPLTQRLRGNLRKYSTMSTLSTSSLHMPTETDHHDWKGKERLESTQSAQSGHSLGGGMSSDVDDDPDHDNLELPTYDEVAQSPSPVRYTMHDITLSGRGL